LKARLQKKEPVLYLQSPSWTTRGGAAEKEYRVFSNMDAVELFHNGRSLGVQRAAKTAAATAANGFRWKVVLRPGANALLAKGVNTAVNAANGNTANAGATREHGFTVNYDPARAPQIAPIIPKR
jgi:beta-galactosidase